MVGRREHLHHSVLATFWWWSVLNKNYFDVLAFFQFEFHFNICFAMWKFTIRACTHVCVNTRVHGSAFLLCLRAAGCVCKCRGTWVTALVLRSKGNLESGTVAYGLENILFLPPISLSDHWTCRCSYYNHLSCGICEYHKGSQLWPSGLLHKSFMGWAAPPASLPCFLR